MGIVSASWNHTLRRMTPEQVEQWRFLGWTCSWPKCKEKAEFEATFDSVTGAAGRVNTRRKNLCDGHAQRFAATNGLAVPSV